jgi:hypothetical protein
MICSALDKKTQKIALFQKYFFENKLKVFLVQIQITSSLAQAGCLHRSYRACWLKAQLDMKIIKHQENHEYKLLKILPIFSFARKLLFV